MQGRTLVFTTCYNERENIGALLDEIVRAAPDADILAVDDNSPDGTWSVLEAKRLQYPQLVCVQRPRKLGIGSAHKYALFYAMREGYTTLVTMDADFSHEPAEIPRLLARHGPNTFVTGSRYCAGGKCDYTGYRNVVSRLGNIAARLALGVRLRELTTYFRVFDVASLRRLPLRHIAASGYSYGVQLVHYLNKAGIELREVPIHFVDRTRGASKIPRAQVLWSALDLARLFLTRVLKEPDLAPDIVVADACPSCGDRALAMKRVGTRGVGADIARAPDVETYRCTTIRNRQHSAVYMCLCCGLDMHLHCFDRHVVADLLQRDGVERMASAPDARFARLRFALAGLARGVPAIFRKGRRAIGRRVPAQAMARVSRAGIKTYIARKK